MHFTDVQAWPGFISSITTLIVVMFNIYASLHNATKINEVKSIVNGTNAELRGQVVTLQHTVDDLRQSAANIAITQATTKLTTASIDSLTSAVNASNEAKPK